TIPPSQQRQGGASRASCRLGEGEDDREEAGGGNRTRMTSLEGWGSAIELRPRASGTILAAAPKPGRSCARPAPRRAVGFPACARHLGSAAAPSRGSP